LQTVENNYLQTFFIFAYLTFFPVFQLSKTKIPMALLCKKCGYDIDPRTANVQTNLVQCPKCYTIHQLDELIAWSKHSEKLPEEAWEETPIRTKEEFGSDFFEEDLEENDFFENDLLKNTNSNITNFNASPQRHLEEPLKGSKIALFETRSTVSIKVFAIGLEFSDTFIIIFATFWLSFVAVWTLFASMGSVLFALFSIPFWFAGIFMISQPFRKIFERQDIEIDRYTMRIIKKNPFRKKIYEIDIADINAIRLENKNKTGKLMTGTGNDFSLKCPTITVGAKRFTFMEMHSDLEQVWAVRVVKSALLKFANKEI
jgi:hypothetical protein